MITEASLVAAVGAMVFLWPVTSKIGWLLTVGVLCAGVLYAGG